MNLTTIPIPAWNGTTGNYSPGRIYYNAGPKNGKTATVDKIVYHWIDGRLSTADDTFRNPYSVHSAHFAVENNTVHQYVKLSDTAYNAGVATVNAESVAIEHSAQPGRDASDATYESSAQIVYKTAQALGKRVDDFQHIPHNKVIATACPGTIDIARIVNRAREIERQASPAVSVPVIQAITVSSPAPQPVSFFVTVTIPQLRVRTAPTTDSPERSDKLLVKGDRVEIAEAVQGQDPYNDGRSIWLHTKVSGLYIWAAGTDYQPTPNQSA